MINDAYHRPMATIVLALLVLVIPGPLSATAGDHDAARHTDPAWSYDTPVQPSPRPTWMEKVVLISETPWADARRQTLKPHIRRLKDAGFVVTEMYPDGFCRLYAPTAGETWPQECHDETKAMHAQGMKVLAGVYPFVGSRGPRDLLTSHPEWRLRKQDKVPVAPGEGCLLSPFGEALIELLVARIREFDVDGFQFDGWYQCEFCRCPSCLANYKHDTGRDVPAKMDIADPAYLRYMVWRDQKLFERMVQLRKAVHAVKPDAVLVNWNNRDAGTGAPSWMPEALNAEVDWVNKEWWDTYDVSAVWLIKRLRGSAGDRPAGVQPYMFMRHGYDVQSGVYHGSSAPSEEVFYRMHKVLASGSIPILWPGARQAWTEADSDRMSRDLVDFLPWVHQTETLKYVACLDSVTTAAMARRSSQESGVLAHRGGIARALVEAHIPFDVLSEHNVTLDRLSAYKVLALPNAACMSDRLVQVIHQYVAAGGGLVATYESSLYDAWGDRRADFALRDLFGASYAGHVKIGPSRIGFAKQSHPVADDPAIRQLTGTRGMTTYWGRFALVKDIDRSMIAPLTGITATQDANGKDGVAWTPLLVGNRGGGRVAYFPAAIDAAYYEAGYPYQRLLLVNAVHWAAASTPPVRVVAPMCVQADYLTQQSGSKRRVIVHLLNDINTTTGHGSKEEKEYTLREETVALHGLTVTFAGPQPSRVFAVPGHLPLEVSQTSQGWSVAVPPLALHSSVVAEYGP